MQAYAVIAVEAALSHDSTSAKEHLKNYKGPFAQATFL